MYTWLDIHPVYVGTHADAERLRSEELARLTYLAISGIEDLSRRIVEAGRTAAAYLARRHRRRLAIAQLSALDERLLADIGLTREAIPAVVDAMVRAGARGPVTAAELLGGSESSARESPRRASTPMRLAA